MKHMIKSLECWNDKQMIEFEDWGQKVTNSLFLIYGQHYCSLAYVISMVTDYERLIYHLLLNGIAYNCGNETLFSMIQLAIGNIQAETWIHITSSDGMDVGQ